MTAASDEATNLAETIQQMDRNELARRIRDELDVEAREALRRLVHPETGERLQAKGITTANPPRHETGSLSDKK